MTGCQGNLRDMDENEASKKRVPAGKMLRRQRIAAGVVFLIMLACDANAYMELGIFGRFAKGVMATTNLLAFVWIMKYGPTIFRLRAYQRLKRRRSSPTESL